MSKRPRADLPRYAKMIGDARRAKKLTQAELAKLVGLEETTIRKYENGQRFPGFNELYEICNILELDIWEVTDADFRLDDTNSINAYTDKPFRDLTAILEQQGIDIIPLSGEGYTGDTIAIHYNGREKIYTKTGLLIDASAIRHRLQEQYKDKLAKELLNYVADITGNKKD